MILGDYNKLKVLRESDIAYVLTDGNEEVFLHKREALKKYEVGEEIEVFLYSDNKRRITASTKQALITVNKPAFLEVVAEKEGLGYFLHYNMSKDLLLAYLDIPFEKQNWPQIGDKLYVYLKTTNDNFRAKILPRQAVREHLTPTDELKVKESYDAYISYVKKEGLICFTLEGHEIFIHINNTREIYRVGQLVHVLITEKKDFRTYNGTLTKAKEIQIEPDAAKVLEFLKKHKVCFLTDESTPLDIYKQFQMSKSAYKRAIGHLYKTGLIILEDDAVILKEKKE